MAVDLSAFETLTPFQFITFTIPTPVKHRCYIKTPLLRVSVLDSPIAAADGGSPIIAAMIVPENMERDWNFCTESGHLLLLFYNFWKASRLILIGNNLSTDSESSIYIRPPAIDPIDKEKLENELKPLVIALHPVSCFQNGVPKPLFLSYEDDVLYSVIIDKFVGPFVGEFAVEDVELESDGDNCRIFRRRLRFKRMPNLIQSEVTLVPIFSKIEGDYNTNLDLDSLRKLKNVEFHVNTKVLVHPCLDSMVSGLLLVVSHLNKQIQQEFTPRALCLGVGGGALLSFLNTQLGFQVVGVEADEVVLHVAKQYFGLNDGESIQLIVKDAIKLIDNVASNTLDAKFDVVMVDLDSSDARTDQYCAPPNEFVRKPVFQALKLVVHDLGVVVINVIPLNQLVYETLIKELQDVFHKVYEIDVDNDGNFVLMATLSPVASSIDSDNDFLSRLKSVISGSYMDTIMEV